MKKTWMTILILGFIVVLAGCSSQENSSVATESTTANSEQMSSETTMEMTNETTIGVDASTEAVEETTVDENGNSLIVFTTEELAKFNGQNGQPAYVAYEGKVYDVSEVKEWKTGTHQRKYEAGKDYTDVLNNIAPHPASFLLDKGVLVGILK